jgi:hypothetical protein
LNFTRFERLVFTFFTKKNYLQNNIQLYIYWIGLSYTLDILLLSLNKRAYRDYIEKRHTLYTRGYGIDYHYNINQPIRYCHVT